jgi:crossover junction endodeoxyribonuclease RuvC
VTRVLGLDPGSRFTGFGCIEARGNRCQLIAQGRISCGKETPLAERLAVLSRELVELLDRLEPAVVAVEEPFHGANTRSLIVLAQARGALLATLGARQVPVAEYSPAEVKKAVTGNGRADKQQVSRMVSLLLGGVGPSSADAADALAVALCFAAGRALRQAVAVATGGTPRPPRGDATADGTPKESVAWHAPEES